MEGLVGTLLDNTYRIEKLLGQGGMGAVFKAQDITLNRPVAIKVMHGHIAQQQGFRERFLQEARAIAALDHPGIVQIYSFSRDPKLLYIAMAFVQGQNLGEWIQLLSERDMVVSLAEALAIVELTADALDYAHRRGVYHRDVKPGNMILRPLEAGQVTRAGISYQPVVTDFGLAKLAEGGVMSMPGTTMGTPAYMAPEQCEGLEIDGRADVYALGVVLYHLLTGRLPYPVRTLTEAIRAHTTETPPPPRSIDASIPSQVERIILKAMARRPEDRYQTADEVAQATRLLRENLDRSASNTLAAPEPGHASLMTMMAEGGPEPAPQSDLWPTPPSQPTPGGQIVTMRPDGTTRALAVGNRQQITIGRDPDNDIVLEDDQVSRHHAQITIRDARHHVTDLNSTNGTWMGNNKLLPGVAELWRPSQVLRIGGHFFRLQAAAAVAPEPSAAATFAPGRGSEGQEPIQITLEPNRLRVRPGTPGVMTIRLLNRQQQVDHLQPVVEGIPSEWVTLPEQSIRLAPGDAGSLTMRLQPPRSSESRAGLHELTVRVRSGASPGYSASAKAEMTIEPFRELGLSLTPRTITNSARAQITLENRGNAPETVVLKVEDPDEALQRPGASAPVTVAAGGRHSVAFPLAMGGKRPIMGNVETHSYSVAAVAEDQQLASTQGTLRVKPYLPVWAIPLFTTLAILVCGASALAYSRIQGERSASATAEAMLFIGQTQTLEALSDREQTLAAEARITEEAQTAAALATAETEATATADAEAMATLAAEDAAAAAATQTVMAQTAIAQQATATPTDTATPQPTDTATVTPTPTPVFAPNETKGFAVTGTDVGTLTQICLRHDNSGHSPGWFVDRILVDTGAGYINFGVNRWIAVDQDDGSLEVCSALPTPTPTATAVPGPTATPGGFFIIPTIPLFLFPTPTPTPGFGFIVPTLIFVPPPQLIFTPVIPLRTYDVLVITGNQIDGGTSAVVSIRLHGATRDTDWIVLGE